jgi:nuclear transport factor 2 (NTF2) superfamily protein
MTLRPPPPPFTQETAILKVRLAEDGWNSRDPEKVSLAYTVDSRWRNRAEFAIGTVLVEPEDQRSNSTAVSGVEQQIKTFASAGRSSGSGA